MTIDLTRPEHREALKWACSVKTQPTYGGWSPLQYDVLRALSSPSDSAALVRALLAGCGVDVHEHHEADWDGECDSEVVIRVTPEWGMSWHDYENANDIANIPTLILRLLACTTKEEALVVLREVGR